VDRGESHAGAPMLQVEGLRVGDDRHEAVPNATFEIRAGEILVSPASPATVRTS